MKKNYSKHRRNKRQHKVKTFNVKIRFIFPYFIEVGFYHEGLWYNPTLSAFDLQNVPIGLIIYQLTGITDKSIKIKYDIDPLLKDTIIIKDE